MVATDTVVGIVGAVVLVAVMAGVFVYEYNNTPEGELSEEQAKAHFEEDYAGLTATDDLDGDGTANFQDNDLDGDNINNTEDDELAVFVSVSGTVAAATGMAGTPYTLAFSVSNGTEHFGGMLTYARQAGAAAVPSLQATVTGPDGFSVAASSTTAGNTVTLTFDVEEPLSAGDYTLTVSHVPAAGPLTVSPATAVSGMLELHYLTPGEQHTH